jgi:hypothetical protein
VTGVKTSRKKHSNPTILLIERFFFMEMKRFHTWSSGSHNKGNTKGVAFAYADLWSRRVFRWRVTQKRQKMKNNKK